MMLGSLGILNALSTCDIFILWWVYQDVTQAAAVLAIDEQMSSPLGPSAYAYTSHILCMMTFWGHVDNSVNFQLS